MRLSAIPTPRAVEAGNNGAPAALKAHRGKRSNGVAAWYDGGKDDPNLVLLRFDLGDAEIWTADVGIKGMFKLMTGMKMKESDLGKHAEVAL